MSIDEIKRRLEIEWKWRDAWVSLSCKNEPNRLQSRQDRIERKAGLANKRIKRLVKQLDTRYLTNIERDVHSTSKEIKILQKRLNEAERLLRSLNLYNADLFDEDFIADCRKFLKS